MPRDFDVITVISPARFADSPKDQDRAAWYPDTQTACVADGTTSSLFAAQAAELVVRLARRFFAGDAGAWLAAAADCLFACRDGAVRNPPRPSGQYPAAMEALIADVLRRQAAQSYQTTCVAARIKPSPAGLDLQMLRVGDSSILVFDAAGTVRWPQSAAPNADDAVVSFGDPVVVQVVETASSRGRDDKGMRRREALCRVDHVWSRNGHVAAVRSAARVGDLVAVPAHLVGAGCPAGQFRHVAFSRLFRILNDVPRAVWPDPFAAAGSVTHVLPDSIAAGHWSLVAAQFPADCQIVLASDGFTRCFADANAVWRWVNQYRALLADPDGRDPLLDELHAGLRARVGDDDISFVWVAPAGGAELEDSHD